MILKASGLILVKHWGGYKLSLKNPFRLELRFTKMKLEILPIHLLIFLLLEKIEKKIHIDTRGVDGLPKA